MPSMTEELSRIAMGIAAARRQRADEGRERREAARQRHDAVAADVQQMMFARHAMAGAQRIGLMAEQQVRHHEVAATLHGLSAARTAMASQQDKQLAAVRRARRSELNRLAVGFRRERRDAQRDFGKLTLAARGRRADFMNELTSEVAALRDGFAAAQQERSGARRMMVRDCETMLAAYAQDRLNAGAAWRGAPAQRSPGRRHHGQHGHAASRAVEGSR